MHKREMDQETRTAIDVLRRTIAASEAQVSHLKANIEQLHGVIRQLQGADSFEIAQQPTALPMETAPPTEIPRLTTIVARQELVAEQKEFPIEKLQGLSRIEVAKAIARDFDGYLTTRAYRKILADSGVLKGTNQVGSIASRLLVHSDEFERVSEGLYRLKDYKS